MERQQQYLAKRKQRHSGSAVATSGSLVTAVISRAPVSRNVKSSGERVSSPSARALTRPKAGPPAGTPEQSTVKGSLSSDDLESQKDTDSSPNSYSSPSGSLRGGRDGRRPKSARAAAMQSGCTCKSLSCGHPSHRVPDGKKKPIGISADRKKSMAIAQGARKAISETASQRRIFTIFGGPNAYVIHDLICICS